MLLYKRLPENLVFTTPTWLGKETSRITTKIAEGRFVKALIVIGTFNARA